MVTWQEQYLKAQTIAQDNTSGTLVQLKQDINTGYHLFNSKFARYYLRKQQFADLVANQQLYQTPIDCIRVMGMTVQVSENFQPTVKEIRSEYEWRQIVSWKTASNYPAWYYMIGNDTLALYPTPSQDVVNGLRFYYQPMDHDLSIDDITSTSNSSGGTVTVTVTNGSQTVTASSGIFTAQMAGLWFQLKGVTDLTWYEILSVPSATTLTLKSAFAGISGAAQSWRIGQLSLLPSEFQDMPMHYALFNYFSAKGNESRATLHKGLLDAAMNTAEEEYSSSNQSKVMTQDDYYLNPWLVPPLPFP